MSAYECTGFYISNERKQPAAILQKNAGSPQVHIPAADQACRNRFPAASRPLPDHFPVASRSLPGDSSV
ncbi:MAG: hypothetical protein IM598_11935 [Chitinophagaceae bacterium]|nr:hypothetical protein [Chitinophagaceae bacterium]MCA6453516.1 hypothetical protein [Chitinophagaceae bacterium]MCA6459001.1 hypothetical protein [Chitinophagaceae bacterium]MCA6465531.1 hypothetical protein [Chitinophagaceae bacterium]